MNNLISSVDPIQTRLAQESINRAIAENAILNQQGICGANAACLNPYVSYIPTPFHTAGLANVPVTRLGLNVPGFCPTPFLTTNLVPHYHALGGISPYTGLNHLVSLNQIPAFGQHPYATSTFGGLVPNWVVTPFGPVARF